jgi:hypothetical protein
MVVGQYISTKELFEASPEKRDQLIKDAFGLSEDELEHARRPIYESDHLETVARIIYEKTNDPISLTIANIAAVGSSEWEGMKTYGEYSRKLARVFRYEKHQISAIKGIKVSNTHLLRKKIGAYHGNLEETAPLWKVKPSPQDLLRSIKLPESPELDYETSQLIGIIFADGFPATSSTTTSSKKGSRTYLTKHIGLSGLGSDEDFYELMVKPKIKKIFNCNVNVNLYKHKKGKVIFNEKEVTFNDSETPVINIISSSINQFLYNIGFPYEKKEDIPIPYSNIDGFSYDKKAFLEGVSSCTEVTSKKLSDIKRELDYDPTHAEKIEIINPRRVVSEETRQNLRMETDAKWNFIRKPCFFPQRSMNPKRLRESKNAWIDRFDETFDTKIREYMEKDINSDSA